MERGERTDEMMKQMQETEHEVEILEREEERPKELEVSDTEDLEEQGYPDLLTACPEGMTEVVQRLLKTEADVTLCDCSQRTELRLSPTELRGKVLGWMLRSHLAPQAQLLQASWQGDLHSLQHLLAQTERLDLNSSNSDRATPVMLAVSDSDLFENAATWLPWEHSPVEVVKELLKLSADLQPQDHAANINSPLKEESVHRAAEALSHTELDTDGLYPDQQTATSPAHTLTHQPCFLMHSHTEEILDLPGCLTLPDHHKRLSQDKGNPLSFQNAMETLRDIRQAYQDAERGSSRGDSSLPSLRDNRSRRWSRVEPAPSCGVQSPRRSCLPVPPRHRERTKSEVAASRSLPGLLSVTESSQLSQSAPSVMEPLLSSDIMLQARAHIQTRLGSNSAVNNQKGLLSALHPRTPKLLAPLDRRPALPVLKQSVPLKPISQSPLSSMTRLRRERLSWGSPRAGAHSTKGGSEESGSSSSSSNQSSMDLEDEDEDDERNIPERNSEIGNLDLSGDRLLRRSKDRSFTGTDLVRDAKLHFILPPLLRSASDLLRTGKVLDCEHDRAANINNAKPTENDSDIKHSVKINIQITLGAKEENDNVASTLEPDAEIIPANTCNIIDELHHVKEAEEDMKVHKQVVEDAKDATVKTSTDPKTGDKMAKSLKPGHNKGRRNSGNCELRANNQTSHPSDILAHNDRSSITQNKSRSNLKVSAQVKDKVKVKGANCGTDTPSPRKKVVYHPQKTRAHSEKHRAQQQHVPVRELNSARHVKNLTAAGTPRSKSAVDFLTYKDMFQQIQSGDEGPAIYEMFAGPVYDNLRISSTCDKTHRQVQPSLPRKTQQSHKVKHRPLKQPQGKLKRSPKETKVVPAKNKAKLASSTATLHVTPSPKTDNLPKLQTELVPSTPVELCCDNSQDKHEDQMLSTIEEALSKYGSDSLKSDEKSLIRPRSYSLSHTKKQKTFGNSSAILNGLVPEPALHHNQLKTNTWTSSSSSSSSDTVVSPVYQRFLDEVGDGPLTDDLLQCLAEELISLDERDMSIAPCPDTLKSSEQNSNSEGSRRDEVFEAASADGAVRLGSGLNADDTITWTKGEVLGRGAYGTVYCGLTSQGQLIAVKQVCLDTSDPAAAEREYNRLQEEVELLKTLRHANIVGFLGTSLHQHVVSIFMEYVPGGSIASILHRFGPLPERVLVLYTHQMVEGVAYLHLNRVIHRDLKGNNVMLMPTGVIKLIDFGCARRLSCLNHTASSSDLLKSVHGTPYWMAPEVISETGYGRKSDIWSVGCTVFEMATGKPPLANMDKMAAMFYIGAKRGLMPSLPDGFSENAQDFVKICLTSDQRLRPSADQLLKHSFISKSQTPVISLETRKQNGCSHSGLCC